MTYEGPEKRGVPLPTACQAAVTHGVSTGVVDGFKLLLKDDEFVRAFWATGFKHICDHANTGVSKWAVKRFFTWIVTALMAAGLVWLVKSGYLK